MRDRPKRQLAFHNVSARLRNFCIAVSLIAILNPLTVRAQSIEKGSDWERPLDPCWSILSRNLTRLLPASDNVGSLFYTETPASIISIAATAGDRLWVVDLAGRLFSNPEFSGESLYAGTVAKTEAGNFARVYRIDAETGLATAGTPVAIPLDSLFIQSGDKFAAITKDGRAVFFGFSGLTAAGSLELREVEGAATLDDRFFAWNKEGLIAQFALDGTGSLRGYAEFTLEGGSSGSFYGYGKRIFAGSADGFVFAVRSDSGEVLWKSRTGGSIDELYGVEEDLLALSRDNFVYKLSGESGQRIWKRKLAGRIVGGVKLDDEHFAFTSIGSNEIAIVRLGDGKLVNSVAVEGAAYFVSPPLVVRDLLIAVHDKGLSAYGTKSTCGKK